MGRSTASQIHFVLRDIVTLWDVEEELGDVSGSVV